MNQKLITRKQISARSGLSVDEIRRNEKRFGLDKCKISINERNVKYREHDAEEAMRHMGLYA